MKRFVIASLAALMVAAPQAKANNKPYKLPSYLVVVTLTKKADDKLSAAKELVHVNAHYYGKATDPKDGDKNGDVALGDEDADIDGSSAASFGKAKFDPREFAKIYDGSPRVHITVAVAKGLVGGDVLTCTEFKDTLPTSPLPRIPISCKLSSE